MQFEHAPGRFDGNFISAYKHLRLDCTAEGEFSVQELGCLFPELPSPYHCKFISIRQNYIIFQFEGILGVNPEITLFWDSTENRVSGWVSDLDLEIYAVRSRCVESI